MAPWETSHPWSSKPTTLPSTESRNPYRPGGEPGALHFSAPRASCPRSAGSGRYASGEPLVIDDQAPGVNGEDEPTVGGVAVTPCG